MKIDELKDSKLIEFFCNYGTFSDRKVRQISKHDLLINMTPNNMFKIFFKLLGFTFSLISLKVVHELLNARFTYKALLSILTLILAKNKTKNPTWVIIFIKFTIMLP